MRRFISNIRNKAVLPLAVMLVGSAGVAHAEGQPIGDDELGEVWGQAMFSVDNRSSAEFDFTRITLNADMKLNAAFSNIRAGGASLSDPSIDIGALNFANNGLAVGAAGYKDYVELIDPYIELVYDNQSDAANREIIGARIGFGGMTGNMGALINRLRGKIEIDDGMATGTGAGVLTLDPDADRSNLTAGMSTQFNCSIPGQGGCGADGKIAMSQISELSASGASDFFISLLSKSVDFADADSNRAAAGVSVNWTKGLSYKSMGVAPNALLGGSLPPLTRRQGG